MVYETPYGPVTIPEFKRNIAISYSGGADSTILLYCMVAVGLRPRIFFIKNANSKLSAAINCVDFINAKFDTKLVVEEIDRITEGHHLLREISRLGDMSTFLYTGVTKNPPVDIGGLPPNRPSANNTVKYITPFFNFDKRVTIFLYKEFDLQSLLDLTYTCTQHSEIPCNQCFACLEKNWAIKEVQ